MSQHRLGSVTSGSSYDSSRRLLDPSVGVMVRIDDGRSITDGHDVHSDCDSEGNPPPATGSFVPPAAMEGVLAPPPRTNAEIKLPFSSVRNRLRYRDQFASKLYYEEWVEGQSTEAMGMQRGSSSRRAVRKLEEDSDYPVGRPYFWRAMCPTCNVSYHPHIPSAWSCPTCKGRVWQLPDDPESKACAVCRRAVAKIRVVRGHRLRSPISLNGHNCKRCGRVVCDDCYDPNPRELHAFGFTQPEKVCTACVDNIKAEATAPEDDDLGVMNEEYALKDLTEDQMVRPYWPPHCASCNVYLGEPPPKWECRTCKSKVWQPTDAPESAECWLCRAKQPKVRCHKCGQLVCDACGSYAQPLSDMGFALGEAMTVCRGCYGGISNGKGIIPDDILDGLMRERNAHCRGQERAAPTAVTRCALCTSPCTEGLRQNCSICGWLCCLTCTQYKQAAGGGKPPQVVCTLCFDPRKALLPDHRDQTYWPPRCAECLRTWLKPPEMWRCPFQCGNVWQPFRHVASKACASCGKATGASATNCRCCGRIVCGGCGSNMAEVPELGFTRGAKVPRCPQCKPAGGGAAAVGDGDGGPTAASSPPRKTPPPKPANKSPVPGRGRGGPTTAGGRGGGSPSRGGGSPARGSPGRGTPTQRGGGPAPPGRRGSPQRGGRGGIPGRARGGA